MRRPNTRTALRASAAVLALGLLLGACSGEAASDDPTTPSAEGSAAPDAPPTASAEDIAALEAVEVQGEGAEAAVTLPETPFTVSAAVARQLSEGDGDEIAEGDLVELHSTWFDGEGKVTQSTWEEGAAEQMVLSENSLSDVLTDILIGGKVGVRFLYAVPTGEETASVAVGEIIAKRPGRAVGTPVEPADGLPAVTLLENGAPTIEPINGEAPGEFIVQPLIEGEGPEVTAGQSVTVHYTGWLWDGKQFDSSWDRGMTFTVDNVGEGQVIDGWNEGLVGQKVGSQVMLVVPPEKGYGDQEQQGIPPNSTLVFVVDVLGAS